MEYPNITPEQEETKKIIEHPVTWVLVAVLFLILAIVSPVIFTQCSWFPIFPSDVSDIYSGVNIMTPFIAFAAALLTFAAFKVQYDANKKMFKDRQKQEIENQFYEMLKIHKDNVNEITWENWMIKESSSCNSFDLKKGAHWNNRYGYNQMKGRKVFEMHLYEYLFIQYTMVEIVKKYHKKPGDEFDVNEFECKKKVITTSYHIYMRGIEHFKYFFEEGCPAYNLCQEFDRDFETRKKAMTRGEPFMIAKGSKLSKPFVWNDSVQIRLILLQMLIRLRTYKENLSKSDLEKGFTMSRFLTGSYLFEGRYDELNHYYRHLYQMVNIVANYDESVINDLEKRKYLKMLRAQLTGYEQLMLLFNWISGLSYPFYGRDWETLEKGNHFISKFKMVYNANFDSVDLISKQDIGPLTDFIYSFNPNCEKENLFEYGSWN